MKTIYIGADSAGYELKEILKEHLTEGGYTVKDLGTDSTASCHYPIFAAAVARSVQADKDSLGILVCGTGIGMSMAANRVPGIRAALCTNEFHACLLYSPTPRTNGGTPTMAATVFLSISTESDIARSDSDSGLICSTEN